MFHNEYLYFVFFNFLFLGNHFEVLETVSETDNVLSIGNIREYEYVVQFIRFIYIEAPVSCFHLNRGRTFSLTDIQLAAL